jgi:glycosyltransferase involved in cell wall biosynthesis
LDDVGKNDPARFRLGKFFLAPTVVFGLSWSGDMRVAFVHEWLVTYAGSEKVLSEMLSMFPDADLYSLVDFSDGNFKKFFKNKTFKTTFLQIFHFMEKLPLLKGIYRYFLPLMPIAIEQFDLSRYDVIISNSHAVAKGIITGPDQLHISYCYTPMRYAWDLQHQYLRDQNLSKGIRGALARWLLHKVRIWDVRTANGVDHFIACSHYIKRRIWRVYRRESFVIYPGVDVDQYRLGNIRKDDYYVTASRLVPYKQVHLIAEAFKGMPERKLVIIGDGPMFKDVLKHAAPNLSILGYQPNDVLLRYLRSAKAFVFAAEEDFGISPLEAQACGTPVLAYGKGGARETVVDGVTGLFFAEQSAEAIRDVVERYERDAHTFDPVTIRRHAETFSIARFRREFKACVDQLWDAHRAKKTATNARIVEGVAP